MSKCRHQSTEQKVTEVAGIISLTFKVEHFSLCGLFKVTLLIWNIAGKPWFLWCYRNCIVSLHSQILKVFVHLSKSTVSSHHWERGHWLEHEQMNPLIMEGNSWDCCFIPVIVSCPLLKRKLEQKYNLWVRFTNKLISIWQWEVLMLYAIDTKCQL